jgi:opacity protein-like surface antigen
MKSNLLILFILTIGVTSYSQDSKLSFELNYPIPIDENYVGDYFTGIIDFGIDYRFIDASPVELGASFNGGILTTGSDFSNGSRDFKITSYLIQPRIFGELILEGMEKFRPSVGLGYTLIIFQASIADSASNEPAGFNVNLGLSYDLFDNLFVQAQYDFVKLSAGLSDEESKITYNTNVNLLKIGLGYRI